MSSAVKLPVTGLVHKYVPPTPVTSGSEAGHPTLGYGIVAGFLTGSFLMLAVPKSPDDASTVMPAAWAATNASRRFSSDRKLANDSSAAPKLCEITAEAVADAGVRRQVGDVVTY